MMAWWRNAGLRLKLIAGAVSVIVALTVIYSLIILDRVRKAHDLEIQKRGRAIARQLADEAEFPMRTGDLTALKKLADEAVAREEVVGVELVELDTGKTVSSGEQVRQKKEQRLYCCELEVTPLAFEDEIEVLSGNEGSRPGRAIGKVTVTISLAESDRVIKEIEAGMAIAAIALMTLAIVINVQLARRVTSPLMKLAKGAKEIGEGKFDTRIDEAGGGEVGMVAEQFNRMAQNLKLTMHQMIQQEKMASLGRMASGITHEIGNPLNSILLDAGLLLESMPEGPERESLKAVQVQARRMKEIVNNLLDYAHASPVEIEAVEISGALNDALRVLSHPLAKSALEIECDLPARLPRVRAIRNMCVQVFINVIANAIEATGRGGKLRVEARNDEDRCCIEVRFIDNGPGVTEDQLESIFEPFFTTKAIGEGTGLGLSICYQIMSGFGGGIRAERARGGGLEIVIEFKQVK